MCRIPRWSFLLLGGVVVATAGALWWLSGEYNIQARLDCGHSRQIDVLTDRWEFNPGLCYRVWVGSEEVVPITAIYTYGVEELEREGHVWSIRYRLLSAEDGSLVGVTSEEFPYTLFVLHDFQAGVSYPYMFTEVCAKSSEMRRWAQLRKRLEREHPEIAKARKLRDSEYLESIFSLDLSYSAVSDAEIGLLTDARMPTALSLEGTAVSDRGLALLAGLENSERLTLLDVDYTEITDGCVASLLSLRRLSGLQITGTRLSEAAIDRLKQRVAYVEVRR